MKRWFAETWEDLMTQWYRLSDEAQLIVVVAAFLIGWVVG